MGLSASQGRLLLLTARRSDLEFRAQQISQKRLVLSQQLEQISLDYENATSNRQMKIGLLQQNADGTMAASRTANLNYATLVSGTMLLDPSRSGIQAYSRTELDKTNAYVSSTAYRLVSTDGAIVVSSEEEIPKTNAKRETVYNEPTAVDEYDGQNGESTLYKTVDSTGDKDKVTYSLIPKADSELSKIINENNKTANIQIDTVNGLVQYEDDAGNKTVYDIKTGEVSTTDGKQNVKWQTATLYGAGTGKSDLPQSASEIVTGGNLEGPGADGVYTLLDTDGTVLQRYVIDSSLKYNTTDATGATDGPNYLQDCLRNGKYLIEKYVIDENVDEGYRWSSVSWDATANISDSYYTEDDDAAKAKYDRLQTQIQAQDKKLELELDNIETQRNAVTTEVESVEKVIQEDIEGTFNAFG